MQLIKRGISLSDWIFWGTSVVILLPMYLNIPVFIGAACLLLWHHRRNLLKVVWDWKYLWGFILYTGLVAGFRHNPIGVGVAMAFAFFAYYFYEFRQWLRAENYLQIMGIYVLGSGILALLAIGQYVAYIVNHGYDLMYVFKYNNLQTRAEATFFNANYYGLFILAILVCIAYLWLKMKVKEVRWGLAGLAGLNLIALVLTASRWLWPSLIVSLGIFLVWLKPKRLIYLGGLALVMLGAILVKPNLLPRVDSLQYAFQDRLNLWNTGYQLFLWHPWLGTGPMTFVSFYYLITDEGNMHAHNLYIDTLANFGVVGVLFLLIILVGNMWPYRRYFVRKGLRREWALMFSLIGLILFHGIMDVAILWIQTGYIFVFLLILSPQELLRLSQIEITNRTQLRALIKVF